jgi:hypothetical protein
MVETAAFSTKTEATVEAPNLAHVQALPARPLRLSDAQLDALMMLAKPLQPSCRDAFLKILAHVLRHRHDVGDGELHRIASEVIWSNRLFDPTLSTGGETGARSGRMRRDSKWDR